MKGKYGGQEAVCEGGLNLVSFELCFEFWREPGLEQGQSIPS